MNEWKTVRLGDVCEKGSSNIAQNEIADNNGEYPIYGAAGFIKNVDFYKQDKPYIGIVKDGAGVGRVSVHPAKSSLIGTMQYIFPKENIDIKFLAEFLKYQNLSRFYTGATIPHIYFKDYQNIPLKLPSLQKQKHISAVLDKCAELTVKNKRILEKYDTLIKSRFIEMFGEPVQNPMGWEVYTVEECATKEPNSLKAGPFGSSLKKEFYVETGYKIYGQEQVISGDANFGDYYIDEKKFNELKSCEVKANDVLISLVGTYGKLLIIPQEFQKGIINPRLLKITFDKSKIDTVFFKYFFASDSLQKKLTDNTHGGTMGILNLGIVRKIKIPVPPLSLQNDFAAFVQQIDKSKFTVQKSLEKVETLYKSLMQEYFA